MQIDAHLTKKFDLEEMGHYQAFQARLHKIVALQCSHELLALEQLGICKHEIQFQQSCDELLSVPSPRFVHVFELTTLDYLQLIQKLFLSDAHLLKSGVAPLRI